LVFALSLPFYLAGAVTTLQLLPGLPVSSLMFFCPMTAALIFVFRENKSVGVTELLKRSAWFKSWVFQVTVRTVPVPQPGTLAVRS
jgi:hypothetical protein